MIRKIVAPVAFFIFGMLLAFIESSIQLPVDRNGISHNGVNLFNIILIVIVLGLLLFFEVRIQFSKIQKRSNKYIYLIVTTILMASTTYFWMQFLIWK